MADEENHLPSEGEMQMKKEKDKEEQEAKNKQEEEEEVDEEEMEEGEEEGAAGGAKPKAKRKRRRRSGRNGGGDAADVSGDCSGAGGDNGSEAGGSGDGRSRRDRRQQEKGKFKSTERQSNCHPPQQKQQKQQQQGAGKARPNWKKNSKENARILDPDDPQDALLLALLKRDILAFENALQVPGVRPHHVYGLCRPSADDRPQRFPTCLELAAADPKACDFVNALLNAALPQVQEVRPTPLHVAVRSGAAGNVQRLLQHPRVRVNEVDAGHWTPLHTLMHFYRPQNGYRECLRLLLERRDLDVNAQDKKYATPVHVGARRRQWEALHTLLESRGKDVDADGRESGGRTVREAIADRFLDLLHLLPPFRCFADVDTAAPAMALLTAMQRDDLSTFEEFLSLVDEDSGPVIDEDYIFDRPVSGTCLHISCSDPRKAAFTEALVQAGASPARTQPRNRRNAFHIAAGALNAPAMKAMLEVTRDQQMDENTAIELNEFMLTVVQAADWQGRTPLHMACESAHHLTEGAALAVVRLLCRVLPQEALMVRDNANTSPRQLAEANGANNVAQLLPLDENSRMEPLREPGPDEPSPSDPGPSASDPSDPGPLGLAMGFGAPAGFSLPIPDVLPADPSDQVMFAQRKMGLPGRRRKQKLKALIMPTPFPAPGPLPAPVPPAAASVAPAVPSEPPTIAQLQNLLECGNRGEIWRALESAENLCGSARRRELVSALVPKAAELHKPLRVIKQLVERGADVDAVDAKGRTALYFAARHQDSDMVAYLLRMGANPRKRSVLGHHMLPALELRWFLDNSLSAKNFPGSEDYEVVFDMRLLLQPSMRQFCELAPIHHNHQQHHQQQHQHQDQPPRRSSLSLHSGEHQRPTLLHLPASLPESQVSQVNAAYSAGSGHISLDMVQNHTEDSRPLLESATTPVGSANPPPAQVPKPCSHPLHIALPETQFLHELTSDHHYHEILQHPIVLSYMSLKWKCLKNVFYWNLFLYALFVFALNFYFLSILHYKNPDLWLLYVLRSIVWILLVYFGIREVVQFLAAGCWKYILNPENYLDMIIIAMTIYIEIEGPAQPREEVFVYVLVLSAIELLLILGRVPSLSRNIEMLKVVCKTYFNFLMTYIVLILAFANCFYILFFKHDGYGQTELMQKQNITSNSWIMLNMYPFLHPLWRTIVMMTGEYEAKDLFQMNVMPFTAELIFVIFVFFISIVLCNLLLGLTVDDSQEIRKQSEILSIKSRIQMIFDIELYVIGFVKIARRCCLHSFIDSIEKRAILFQPLVNKVICTLPNQQGKILLSETVFNSEKLQNYMIKNTVLDRALKILRNKEDKKKKEIVRDVDLQTLQNSLTNLTKLVQDLPAIQNSITSLSQVVEELSRKLSNQGDYNEK